MCVRAIYCFIAVVGGVCMYCSKQTNHVHILLTKMLNRKHLAGCWLCAKHWTNENVSHLMKWFYCATFSFLFNSPLDNLSGWLNTRQNNLWACCDNQMCARLYSHSSRHTFSGPFAKLLAMYNPRARNFRYEKYTHTNIWWKIQTGQLTSTVSGVLQVFQVFATQHRYSGEKR